MTGPSLHTRSTWPGVQLTTTPLTDMYFIIFVDGQEYRQYSANEYLEAMEDAAQLDYMYNSPELNDGVQGNTAVEILTVSGRILSDAELDARAAMAD
jgi:hypothetical protein